MKVLLQLIRKDDGSRTPAIVVKLPDFALELKEKLTDEVMTGSCVLVLGEFVDTDEGERFDWSVYPILSAVDFVNTNSILPSPVLENVNHAS